MLAHVDRGHGTPIVLLHGIGCDRSWWDPVADLLVDDHRCIVVDLPGHGESTDEGCDSLSAAAAVQDLIVELDLPAPVVVGHSLGGVTALIIAASFAPRSVVAVDPVPLHLPHLSDSLAPFRDRLLGDDFDAAFSTWAEHLHLDLVPDPLGARLAADQHPRAEVVRSYWSGVFDRDDAVATQDLLDAALATISVPTLICLADPPAPQDASILDQMPTTTVELFAGMGHYLHLVDPARFATRLRRWIATLDETA